MGAMPSSPQQEPAMGDSEAKSKGNREIGHATGSNPADDPDAQGLPSHVFLPEAHAFKRDQLRARLLVSFGALVVLCILVVVSKEYRVMYSLCAGGVAMAVLVLAVRYFIARSNAAQQAQTYQPKV